ncbi:MAG: DUF4266 domain-containing protein [Bacteroidetes bacterium]|nr:DUF4266 domain-containing protein [Bacteroidota bacterium]
MIIKSKIVMAWSIVLICIAGSCTTVKPYQRTYLNDSEMDLSNKSLESFESNFQSYREGAVGGNDGSIGGGCGCN